MWHALKHRDEVIGRDQVARLMRLAGLRGVALIRRRRRAASGMPEFRSRDLVRVISLKFRRVAA